MSEKLSALLKNAEERSNKSRIESAARAKIRALPWISVEDALPLNDFGARYRKYYLVQTYPEGTPFVAVFGYNGENLWVGTHGCFLDQKYGCVVNQWCPLPYQHVGSDEDGGSTHAIC